MSTTTETITNPVSTAKLDLPDVCDMEKKFQSKMEVINNYLKKAHHQTQCYWDVIKVSAINLWQYEEFRLGVYIFGLFSALPAAVFLLFFTLVIFITTVLVGFVWTFFVFSALTIGLAILVPILMGCSVTVGFLIVGYDIYQHLLRLKQANKKTQ
ncbi:hypothetical protein BD408DRAFT_444978 [Parasitella parasitica]|nr:hypothetical protein BD408DRAFT_444978 [Parasitella parasitica]